MSENKIVKLATDKPLTLDCGKSLGPIQTAYTTYGSLNADKAKRLEILLSSGK